MGREAAMLTDAVQGWLLERLVREDFGPYAATLGLVGTSAAARALGERVRTLAKSPATVLVLGETGTGKELVARALHTLSPRADGPFLPHNFSAITDTLVESELFGHAKGSFTGAHADRPGLFELADKGTLFLDEIGDASASVQSRLLRVLQDRDVRRVGDTRSRRVDVRVLAATHRDLEAEVSAGRFRADLYYRLHVLTLRVPPLRDRGEDIPLLAAHVLLALSRRDGVPVRGIRADALEALAENPWPGNVRELMGTLERAFHRMTPDGWIERRSLEDGGARAMSAVVHDRSDLKGRTRAYEAELIRSALLSHGGNKARTARSLGLTRQGLWKKLRRLHVEPDSP